MICLSVYLLVSLCLFLHVCFNTSSSRERPLQKESTALILKKSLCHIGSSVRLLPVFPSLSAVSLLVCCICPHSSTFCQPSSHLPRMQHHPLFLWDSGLHVTYLFETEVYIRRRHRRRKYNKHLAVRAIEWRRLWVICHLQARPYHINDKGLAEVKKCTD